MNIEEFRATFMQAVAPLVEFAHAVRDIFLELAQRLRKALAPLWSVPALRQKRAYASLSQMRKGGSRKARRAAWKMLHEMKRARQKPRKAPAFPVTVPLVRHGAIPALCAPALAIPSAAGLPGPAIRI